MIMRAHAYAVRIYTYFLRKQDCIFIRIRLKNGPLYVTVRPRSDCLGHMHMYKSHAILKRKDIDARIYVYILYS